MIRTIFALAASCCAALGQFLDLADPGLLVRPQEASGGGGLLMNTNGFVGYWRLNNTLNDGFTAARHMTQGASPFFTNGPWGAALTALRTITAGGGYAYLANDAAFESPQFSVVCWVRFPTDSDAHFCGVHGGTASGERSWYLQRQAASNDRWRINTVDSGNTVSTATASIGSAEDSTWNHVVVIVNAATNVSLWKNGVEAFRSTTVAANIADSSGRFGFGFLNNGSTTYDVEIAGVFLLSRLVVTNLAVPNGAGHTNEVTTFYNGGNEITMDDILGL